MRSVFVDLTHASTVRQYHSTYYAPHNLALLITGKVSPTKLLQVLQDTVEPSIIAHQQAHGPKGPSGWKRPFLETGSKGGGRVEKGQKEEVVEFPEKDESSGEVQISWVGPKTTDLMGDAALDLLTTYLSDSAVSPLSKEFIEIDDPFCTGRLKSLPFLRHDALTAGLSRTRHHLLLD